MKKPKTAAAGAVDLQRLVGRPADASREGLAKCLAWIDACREIGWAEEQMDDLEAIFWKYKDKDGNDKTANS